MITNRYKKWIVLWLLFGLSLAVSLRADESEDKEYKIKAAFLFNFFKTVTWPDRVFENESQPFVIGIIGEDPFGEAMKPLQEKTIKNRPVEVRRLQGFSRLPRDSNGRPILDEYELTTLRSCHLLFISNSEKQVVSDILSTLDALPVFTVSEVDLFLERGGMFQFPPKGKSGDFGINLIETERAQLKVSTKLIRIAKKVIKKED